MLNDMNYNEVTEGVPEARRQWQKQDQIQVYV